MADEKSSRAGSHAPATNGDEAKLPALQAALIGGEESGAAAPFDFEAFVAQMRSTRD